MKEVSKRSTLKQAQRFNNQHKRKKTHAIARSSRRKRTKIIFSKRSKRFSSKLDQQLITSDAMKEMLRLFPFDDQHNFDPGLWKEIIARLNEGYIIPDPHFSKGLEKENQRLAQLD